jgi:HK97 family phage portal protein
MLEFLNKILPKREIIVKEIIKEKQKEEVGRIIAPIFREIPPDMKAGKYISEGLKSWVYVAVSAIADEISTGTLNLYKKKGKNWQLIDEHPILDFIEKPNQFQTKEEHFWLTTAFLLCEGEAPWLLNSETNPTEMVLIDPERLKLIYGQGNVEKYQYNNNQGKYQDIEFGKIVFNKLPSYKTPFRGLGKIGYITKMVDVNNYVEEYLRIFFFNNASPGGVLETDKALNKSIVDRIRAQFEKRHKGVASSHRLAVLDNGLKFNNTSYKISDLQVKELDNMIRDRVLSAFKVPKTVAGVTEDVSRANGDTADRVFARRAIKPLMKLIEAQLNQFLLPKFTGGENLWFEFEDPVQTDQKLDAEINQIYLNTGVKTVDEVREELGLEPMKEEEKPDTQEEITPDEDIADEEGKSKGLTSFIKDILKEEMERKISKKEALKFHDQKILITDKYEEIFAKKLRSFFRIQEKKVLSQVSEKIYKKKEISFNEKEATELYVELATPIMASVITEQSILAYGLLGSDASLLDKDKLVKRFIASRSLKVGEATSETTKQDLERILRDWSASEEATTSNLKRSLRDYFGSAEKSRSEAIARTELSRSANWSTVEVYKRSGVVGKQWLTARDEKTCEFCGEMDGKIVKISNNYWDEGETMIGREGGMFAFSFESVGQPPLHPNCRCTVIPIFTENQMGKQQNYKKEKLVKELKKKEEKIKEETKIINKKKKNLEKDIEEFFNITKNEKNRGKRK